MPDVSFSRRVYIKTQADRGGILHNLSIINWPDVYHQENSIASFNNICGRIIDNLIPSRTIYSTIKIKCGSKMNVCKMAHIEKQEAYHHWRRNSTNYT